MKKILLAATFFVALAACNNEADTKDTTTDSINGTRDNTLYPADTFPPGSDTMRNNDTTSYNRMNDRVPQPQ